LSIFYKHRRESRFVAGDGRDVAIRKLWRVVFGYEFSWGRYSAEYGCQAILSLPKNIFWCKILMFLKNNFMSTKKVFTTEAAQQTGEQLGVKWDKYDVEQFRMGMDVELEHGKVDPNTNVTNDDPLMTGKIALAHLNEFPDYYTRLYQMEEEAEDVWKAGK